MMKKSRKGQTMVEYIIVVCLVALAGLAVWGFFGKAAAKKVAVMTDKLDAEEGSRAKSNADSLSGDIKDIK